MLCCFYCSEIWSGIGGVQAELAADMKEPAPFCFLMLCCFYCSEIWSGDANRPNRRVGVRRSAAASDAKVGTPKQEMVEVAAAEEDAATVEQAIAIVGQAIAMAAAEEDAATVGQAIASVLGRDESLTLAIPMIPTSWGRRDSARGGGSRSPAGKGGGCKMKMQDGKMAGDQLEVFDKILEVPSSIA